MMIGFINCSYPQYNPCSNFTDTSTIVGYINESTAPKIVYKKCVCVVCSK